MTKQEIAACADFLVEARRSGTPLEALPVTPASVAEAHAIQDLVTARLGETVGAYKISASSREPTRGSIYRPMIRNSPARFSSREVPHLGVEAEVAFVFHRDLKPRIAPYTRDEVAESVAALPAIEIVSSRYRDPRTRPHLEQVADCMINGALVLGMISRRWSHLDLPNLRVALWVNGKPVLEQKGGHPTGDPLGSAVVFVNLMHENGGVKAGQIVTTGSWTGLRFLQPGDHCVTRFRDLGVAEVLL